MPNFSYKNIKEILNTKDSIRGVRIFNKRLDKSIIIPSFSILNNPEDPLSAGTNVEFHAFYPNAGYVGTTYNVDYNLFNEKDANGNNLKNISLDVHKHLAGLNLNPGPYKIVYNFLRNMIGSAQSTGKLFVSDISEDRKELKLSLTHPDNTILIQELSSFVLQYMNDTLYLPPVILNFGQNNIIPIVNVTSDGDPTYFYVKLFDPLPGDIDLYFQCWLSSEIMKPYIDNVKLIDEDDVLLTKPIKGPNFEVDYKYWSSSETSYKNWTDLLSTNINTSQELLNRYIYNTGSSVRLNIDFKEFQNFIFYSSAEDRVENFYYKLQLIEHYNSLLSQLNTYTGSVDSNKVRIKMLRDKVVSGFDEFEKWMYYETTGSVLYTSDNTGSISPYPKYEVTGSNFSISTKEGKFNLYPTTSSIAVDWHERIYDLAVDYDFTNDNILNKAIPEYLREDNENDQFTTFVNMVGQHFDILYFYTDHLLKKNLRSQHPKDGLSQDLIHATTKNLGWSLSHGTQAKDLWEYALGLSGSGDPLWVGKNYVDKNLSRTEEERTKEVWRRVLNNLPYIYKSKGTARSIKALLAAYGIPQTILSIREYGGPDNADLGMIPRAEWEKHTYYLKCVGSLQVPSTSSYVSIPWQKVNNVSNIWQYPDTITFRWKMEESEYYNYKDNEKQTLLQKNTSGNPSWYVTLNRSGSAKEKGDIIFHLGNGSTYKSASITDEYLYDGVPLNLMIRRSLTNDNDNVTQRYDFILKTEKYGKLVIEKTASISITGSTEPGYNQSWSSDGTLFIGSGSNNYTSNSLSGSIFELRYWVLPLNEKSFDNHVLAPRAYNGNTHTSSFYDLQGQWKFWQKINPITTSSLQSLHPDQTKSDFLSSTKYANLYGFTENSYESTVELYNMEVATVANDTPFSEKVRIDSASLYGPLSFDKSSAVSSFDRFSVDSNKLMVAFSPNHIINEDIYEAIGNASIDDYIGDYGSTKLDEYPRLKWFAREYWKKYKNRNDFATYLRLISIFDFSVFDQIRQTLPMRTNEILGLVIEPNVIERSKVKMTRDFSGLPPEQFIRDTNEISASGAVKLNIESSKSTTVYVGFDEEISSEFTNIAGEYDIETVIETEYQEMDDDIDVNSKLFIQEKNKKIKVEVDKNLYGKNVGVNFKIINTPNNFYGQNNNVAGTMKSFYYVLGKVNTVDQNISGSLNLAFTNTFDRYNVNKLKFDESSENGSWYFTLNSENKRTSVFENVSSSRSDGYYSKFALLYDEPINVDGTNYSSSYYVNADFMNVNNYPTSIKNVRFDGCKLPNSDITNKISYPMYTPNYTYLDINDDPSAIIVLVLPLEVLPEWLQQVRKSRTKT
jgi:hypothetical protein